jgi:uncharacterized protein with HEPN domain
MGKIGLVDAMLAIQTIGTTRIILIIGSSVKVIISNVKRTGGGIPWRLPPRRGTRMARNRAGVTAYAG